MLTAPHRLLNTLSKNTQRIEQKTFLALAGGCAQAFKPQRTLLVGGDGIALKDFLSQLVAHWVGG